VISRFVDELAALAGVASIAGVHPKFGGTMECGVNDTALALAVKKPKRRSGRRTPK
jgi:hypothetical protein